jgi:proteasome accessory factor A
MRKIQGTEHEYTLFCRKMNELNLDPHVIALDILRKSDLHSFGEFTANQSRAYFDVGHLEISTCEVTNFYDLIIWEKAGEKIVDWLRKKAEELHLGDTQIRAYKNNTSPDGTSYGSHENYLVDRNVNFPTTYVRELVPHLTTRMIYTGAGDIIDGKYVLSPSAYLTGSVVSNDTMHNTGVLNTRDEPLASHKLRRLHLQIGDALMNETAIMLRNFTTSFIIRLMEKGMLDDVPKLANPLEDMWHNVEQTNPDKWRVQLENGDNVSPIQIQEYYLSKIEPLVSDEKEKRAFELLEKTLSNLKGKSSETCARNVEWLDRYFAIKEESEKAKDDNLIEIKACKRYSEIGEERSIFYRRQKSGLVDRVIDDEQILRAVHNPPDDTRALLRKKLCETYEVQFLDWDHIVFYVDDERKKIDLDDPYCISIEKTMEGK